jgi:hypothetical protein
MKPIADRAEVALDFPEKTYMGSFTRASRFEVTVEPEGAVLRLAHAVGERRIIDLHLHWLLLADMLDDVAAGLAAGAPADATGRRVLAAAAARLATAAERG